MNKIIITVEGGIIQDITGIPSNIEIEVRDWDIEINDCMIGQIRMVYGEEVFATTWSSSDIR